MPNCIQYNITINNNNLYFASFEKRHKQQITKICASFKGADQAVNIWQHSHSDTLCSRRKILGFNLQKNYNCYGL